jgi:hypothetical protein
VGLRRLAKRCFQSRANYGRWKSRYIEFRELRQYRTAAVELRATPFAVPW